MNHKGFSLIELIVVIILIGILAVSVAPKFDGTASYEAHTHRAQLIASLRLSQQRAMQQTNTDPSGSANYCHQIIFDDVQSRYGIPNRKDCTPTTPLFLPDWQPDATGHIVDSRYQVTFNINGAANPQTLGFDWLGRPTNDCAGGCEISVVRPGEKTLLITIEPEGYIHVFDLP